MALRDLTAGRFARRKNRPTYLVAETQDLVSLHGGDTWSRSSIEIGDFRRLGLRETSVGTREAAAFPWTRGAARREDQRAPFTGSPQRFW